MTDREKLVKILVEADQEIGILCDGCGARPEHEIFGNIADHLLDHGVTVKEMQKPTEFEKMKLCEPCWIERNSKEPLSLEPALILCRTNKDCRIEFIGCGLPIAHKKEFYGKTWRFWAEKPTEEERKAAEWEM